MAAALGLSVEGHLQVEQRLQAMLAAVTDRAPLMDSIGLYLESSTIDRFDDETAPDGSKWSQSIRAKEEGGKTLTDQGANGGLKGSIGYIAGNDQVEWGSNLIYAGVHQRGATITAKGPGGLKFQLPGGLGFRNPMSVTIPARPYLGINADDEFQIIGLAEDYIAAAVPEVER